MLPVEPLNKTTPAPVLPEAGARPKSTKGSIAHGNYVGNEAT